MVTIKNYQIQKEKNESIVLREMKKLKKSLIEHVHWIKADDLGVMAMHGELKDLDYKYSEYTATNKDSMLSRTLICNIENVVSKESIEIPTSSIHNELKQFDEMTNEEGLIQDIG